MLWLPPLLMLALIYHLSSESDPVPVLTAHVWDKLLHGSGYALLGFLFARALAGEGVSWTGALAGGALLASLYGITDEYHQALVPFREADVRDWMADTVGGLVGSTTYVLARRSVAKFSTP